MGTESSREGGEELENRYFETKLRRPLSSAAGWRAYRAGKRGVGVARRGGLQLASGPS
jgi:hypothetical protein